MTSNITRAVAHSPVLANLVAARGMYFRHQSGLNPRLRELAILQVGYSTRSAYEWAHHVDVALSFGVSRDDIRAISVESEGGETHLSRWRGWYWLQQESSQITSRSPGSVSINSRKPSAASTLWICWSPSANISVSFASWRPSRLIWSQNMRRSCRSFHSPGPEDFDCRSTVNAQSQNRYKQECLRHETTEF